LFLFFSSRRRHTRFSRDWIQTCALPILHAPATKREWFDAEASYAKVDTTYGMAAVRRPDTTVQLELGTGYRLQPYADYGTAAIGVIATGGLRLSQRFGDWAEINQRVRVETGRHNTFVRQTLGV